MVLNTTRKETTKMYDNYANTDLLQIWTYCKYGPTANMDLLNMQIWMKLKDSAI